jgi:hypothetical protein
MKWREALDVLYDKKIPMKLKGKFYRIVVRSTMVYGLRSLRFPIPGLRNVENQMSGGLEQGWLSPNSWENGEGEEVNNNVNRFVYYQ